MNEAGRIIRDLRQEAGYTQKTLAEALHVTEQAISKWERGLSFPDVALLPKLAFLIDVDMDLLLSRSLEQEEWVGLIDIFDCDFAQTVYDKPLVYYLLSHYLLLGIRNIHVLTSERNQRYLLTDRFEAMGFRFSFDVPQDKNLMVLSHPWFLFGSNLTRFFQGVMVSEKSIKLVPENQKPVFYFCRKSDSGRYFEEKEHVIQGMSVRTLGRGMICFDMDDYDKALDVASFVRTYQKNTGLLIGSLEEISYKKGIISAQHLSTSLERAPYGSMLRNVLGDVLSKPQVG